MAQLPPKTPATTSHSWSPAFGHQKPPSVSSFFSITPAHTNANLSWVDEFLDFSAARRCAHRRSVSDSVTFLEAGPTDSGAHHQFDRLDDDQLMSMFSDDVPSSLSDHNSINDEKPAAVVDRNGSNEDEEAQSERKREVVQTSYELQTAAAESKQEEKPGSTSFVDPKRVKRILANRQSAQRSRVRKLQYISELERSVTTLQTEVSALSPRVAFLDHQRSVLTVGNSHLKQRIAALAQDRIFKDARQEALEKEIERLRRVYHQQNQNKFPPSTSG